ncbi:hypothetical protein ICV01_00660 [Polynucleobacter sp. MWH-Spelu-300-X4]|uniref:glycosyltransferase family 41 protein n=1 Tax=Polynucleobacter sp. MWH-Spelu-300-X4 TaxID=2689109 RepID=UPI001BFDED26|nr:glycosyltransferase family 41 protein [Polynucleobacter sp. MWH-Spelu-300-X4]QWD79875.1 hypothetical protein ICV01_00660 [Polynucleobacter sp. MWH-Spelu-300-X4]
MSDTNQLASAISLYRENRLNEAAAAFNQMIEEKSAIEPSRYYLGLISMAENNFSVAINHLDQAITINPKKPEYLFNKAICFGQLGNYKDCLYLLDEIQQLLPNSLPVLFNQAVALGKLGKKDSELTIYKKILSLEPSNQDALNNIAVCCNELNDSKQALNYINFLLSINPNHLSALKTKSDIVQKIGLLDDSFECLSQYLIHSYKNNLISNDVRLFCEQIIQLIKIPSNYNSTSEIDIARESVQTSLNNAISLVNLISSLTNQEFEIIISVLLRVNLFYLAYQQKNDRQINENICQIISQILSHRIPKFEKKINQDSCKIKLGVLSRFRYHVDTDILAWIKQLPATDYEIFFIRINGEPTNHYLNQLQQLGSLIDIQLDETNLIDVVDQIRDLQLDALFMQDIGMTSDGKFLANIRFSPLQFTNWSHPVTSGSKVVDYYLSSDLMEPENAENHYTEKLVRLPNLGLFIPPYPTLKEKVLKKLNSDFFNIGCLQSLFKYLPHDDDIFIEICKTIPNAKLVFIEDVTKPSTDSFITRLKNQFKLHMLDFNKHVHIFPRMPHEEFMALMNETDIELDSIGWTGGNTSLQALFLGKPILTIQGEYMRGRHTGAMLNILKIEELPPLKSKNELYSKAEYLFKNKDKLEAISSEILRKNHALFNDQQSVIAIDNFIREHI